MDFRIVHNDISRISDKPITSADQVQSFIENLTKASDKVLQTLQDLASRVDPMFGIDRQRHGIKQRNPVRTSSSNTDLEDLSSSLSRALDRSLSDAETEEDFEYCRGAIALQMDSSRKIEDIVVDGKARMQYTYVCKFCFLHISSYQRCTQDWDTYEWMTLAKSHVIACRSWLDSRALFKCIDCHKNGLPNVTIDAKDFIIHTQEHLRDASTRKVSRESAYSREKGQSRIVPQRRPYEETMAEVEKEIAVYEKLVEMELAGDAEVLNAKAAAVPLVEEDEDENDMDEWYHTPRKAEAKEPSRDMKTRAKPQMASTSAPKSSKSGGKRDVSPLGSSVFNAPTSPPPHQPTHHTAQTEASRPQDPVEKSSSTPALSYSPEQPKDSHRTGTSAHEKEVPNDSRRSSKNVPVAGKAVYEKDASSPSPAQQRQVDNKAQVLTATVVVTEPDDGLASCPCCGRRMKEEAVFKHLDVCPGNSDVCTVPPQQAASTRTQALKREVATHPLPDYVLPNKLTQRMGEPDVVQSTHGAEAIHPVFSDGDAYQAGNMAPSVASTQAYQPAPTRAPPVPPVAQIFRPTVRKPTPAQAAENYEAQRYMQAAMRLQTPPNQRSSRELHVRQDSTPTGSGQRTPQPPGGLSDWQTDPTFDEWQARQ